MMIRHLPLTHPFQVSYARPAGDEAVETNLYVSNLPKTVTEELLDVIFGKYGTIIQKNILRDKLTGQPRGVAFIRYVLCIASLALCLPPPTACLHRGHRTRYNLLPREGVSSGVCCPSCRAEFICTGCY